MTTEGGYRVGETVLLVGVPEAHVVVDPWRQRFDRSAAAGVPAHVTVLYPFLDIDRVDEDTLHTLATLIGGHRAFDVRFEHFAHFPDALYLAPTPDEPFRQLTASVAGQWPEAPPYGGQFDAVVPHLTIAQPPEAFDEATAALAPHLPITARVSSVQLLVSDGNRWHQRADFPLLG